MKNVAGYDVSRLMAGSLGTLGVLLEVSLKVLPAPPAEATLRARVQRGRGDRADERMGGKAAARSRPRLSTSGDLGVRLSGARPARRSRDRENRRHGGRSRARPAASGPASANRPIPCSTADAPLWRLSVKSTTPPLPVRGRSAHRMGRRVALAQDRTPIRATVRDAARAAGGHATLFRGGDKSAGAFHPLPEGLLAIHRRLKQRFRSGWYPQSRSALCRPCEGSGSVTRGPGLDVAKRRFPSP